MQGTFLAGILTERDVLKAAASGSDLTTVPVSAWMTKDPQAASPDTPVEEAAQIMLLNGFRHLPIVEGRRVHGVVSLRDLFSARISRLTPAAQRGELTGSADDSGGRPSGPGDQPQLRVRAAGGQPGAMRARHHPVPPAVEDQDWYRYLTGLEAPRADVAQFVVDEAVSLITRRAYGSRLIIAGGSALSPVRRSMAAAGTHPVM